MVVSSPLKPARCTADARDVSTVCQVFIDLEAGVAQARRMSKRTTEDRVVQELLSRTTSDQEFNLAVQE
jgi:hypothetical protein